MRDLTITTLKNKLEKIKRLKSIYTHRKNDTGIGKTLEDLLGIKENNFRIPDIGEIELKAKRLDSESMLTIATKAPKPKGVNKVLFSNYKYKDRKGCYCLHSTVYGTRYNNRGFKIVLEEDKIILKNQKNIETYWPMSIFYDVLKSKSNKILLVFAETIGKWKTKGEQFHFTKAYLLSNLNIRKFKTAIRNGKLKVDIRIGVYRSGKLKGRYHDHGTGFRISSRDFLDLYDNYKQVI